MKVVQSHKRNIPDTINGESLTVYLTYYSFDKEEIDKLEASMPKGLVISEISFNKHEEETKHAEAED